MNTDKVVRARAMVVAIGIYVLAGCATNLVPLPGLSSTSLSAGEWRGTTTQGMPIEFTVSREETLTALTLGYKFMDCMGTLHFVEINVPTAPNVNCIPGPCRGTLNSYRAFSFVDGSPAGGSYLQVNGLFLPRAQAQGQAIFSGIDDCGEATVQWSAARI